MHKDTSPAGKKSNLTLNFKMDFVCVLTPGIKPFFFFLVFVLCSMPISSSRHLSVQKSFCLRLIAFSFGQVMHSLCSVVIKMFSSQCCRHMCMFQSVHVVLRMAYFHISKQNTHSFTPGFIHTLRHGVLHRQVTH